MLTPCKIKRPIERSIFGKHVHQVYINIEIGFSEQPRATERGLEPRSNVFMSDALGSTASCSLELSSTFP